jgi:hypothetical protein
MVERYGSENEDMDDEQADWDNYGYDEEIDTPVMIKQDSEKVVTTD